MAKSELFNIENQYIMWLNRMNLNVNTMHPQQKIQLKQAFYGAWSQMLALMQGPIPDLSENDGIAVLDDMINQCSVYWQSQAKSGGH